jgi:ferredoxin
MRDLERIGRVAAALPLLLAACTGDFADPERKFGPAVAEDAGRHAVTVHRPPSLGAMDTTQRDVNGAPVGVGCGTCHGPSPAEAIAAADGPEADVHAHIEVAHGGLTCNACHDPEDRTALRLADGARRAFDEAMDLCAQCHGPQSRDYRNGSHGGMNGYWDLRRGPRTRNHCVDCHAPHAPAVLPVQPVLPPRDRYLHGDHE